VLTINGLTTTATAWATTDGKLHATTGSSVVDMNLAMPPTNTPLDEPVAELLDLVNGEVAPTIGQVVSLLQEHGGAIEIPGLGKLEPGYARTGVGARQAVARALSLRMTMYGQDGVAGGTDDSMTKMGRSYAKVIAEMPHAVMGGSGWAAEADLAGGSAHIGDMVPKMLPCQGTDGLTRTNSVSSAFLPGAVLGGLKARSHGEISKSGRVRAWTEGSVKHIGLGEGDMAMAIEGVVGRVNLATDKAGRIVRRNTEGTIPGVLNFQGQSYTLPLDQAPELPPELASMISIETGITDTSDARGLKVTALRITMLDGTAAGTVYNFGNARANIRES
jgi:hypothetical protein